MRSKIRHIVCLQALTIFSGPAAAAGSSGHLSATGTPPGFDELAGPREVLVDVYFGGRKVAETLALTSPGSLRFRSPGEVVAKLPQLVPSPEVAQALSGDLPTNSSLVCAPSNAGRCGILKPEVAGIIYDEDRFRVDVFVSPSFLRPLEANAAGYLPRPEANLSLTNTFGIEASGVIGGHSLYNIQNRTIVGFGDARIRSNLSLASDLGLVVDDLVGEVERKDLRYSAGLFWAPGDEFTGERRIVGAGVGTQFDTWTDPEALRATPLVVFLADQARVEIVVDGRLISGRSYPAGNIDLDTSALPEGSYPVLLRIRHSNGSVEEQQRFFVKNSQIPPAGHPIFYAYAGVLANTRRDQPIALSNVFYYQAGAARRLTNHFALDGEIIGTQHKAMVRAGGWLVEGPARVRAAGLLSSAGDWGALLELSTAGHGPFTMSLDVRRIWSRDGTPLIPLPVYATTFDIIPPTGLQLASGSYTQALASIGLQLGAGFLSIVGSYRKDRDQHSDYALGPTLNLPLMTRSRMQIVFQASAQRTRTSTAGFAGLRLFLSSRHVSMLGTVGEAFQNDRGGDEASISRPIGSVDAQYSSESSDRTLINLDAGADRNISSAIVHSGAVIDSRWGDVRADILHNVEGSRSTQYDIAFQSGFALSQQAALWGSRDLEQSAIIVSLSGDAPDAQFSVLVDEVRRGEVKSGRSLSLFLPGYRTYKVRLVPTASSSVSFDSAERDVTLYPGNVRSLAWRADSYFTLFGQAVSPAGMPIADALAQTAKGIAQTDSNGYFQIDMHRGDPITITSDGHAPCTIQIGDVAVKNDFASSGKLVCK